MRLAYIFLVATVGHLQLAASKQAAEKPPTTAQAPANILFWAPFGSKSHKMFYNGIISAVADYGHKVTVISPFTLPKKHKRIEEIVFKEGDIGQMMANAFTDGLLAATMKAIEKGPELCFSALTSDSTAMALEDKYDLAFVSIFYNECVLGVLHQKKIPFVFVNPAEMFGPYNALRMGTPVFPSFSYNPMLNYPPPMTFVERALSSFSLIMFEVMVHSNFKRIDSTHRHLILVSPDSPSTADIAKEAALMFVNSVRLEEQPRPYMPNVVLAGTIHCHPPKPLPKDLEAWVSDGEGFILFSIGSALRPSDVPEEKEKVLASVFGSLSLKVLWKHDKDSLLYAKTPSNVKLLKWAPQQDLLGHPRIKLFITHGGLHSLQEALYHRVPVVGLPIFGDQEGNTAAAESKGLGRKLSWDALTEESLKAAITAVIGNKTIARNIEQRATLMKEAPLPPTQLVVWWTNYLLKTKGARHLRSAAVDLPWYELYNTDVWAAVVVCLSLLLWILWKLIRALCRYCCCRGGKGDKKATKRKAD